MIHLTVEQAKAIEHIKNKSRMSRLRNQMDGKGETRHPLIRLAIKELTKEQIIEALFYGYKVK